MYIKYAFQLLYNTVKWLAYQNIDIFMKILAWRTQWLGRRKLKIPQLVLHSDNKQQNITVTPFGRELDTFLFRQSYPSFFL